MNIHVVKKGETAGGIALKYSVDERALRRANALEPPGPLCSGQSLFIPAAFPEPAGSMEVSVFTVSAAAPEAAKAFTYLCPYSHSFDGQGALLSPGFHCSSAALRREGCAPLLCLANFGDGGGFSPELAHLVFTRAQLRERLFEELLCKLKANAYYGVQLCFNYLFPFDRDNYSAFVSELSELLHSEGFMLSLELAPPDSASLSAALDYKALGSFADRLSLMFCRWGHACSPPQPIAPLNLIRSSLDVMTELIPAEKMLLGISGCGFDWALPWQMGDRARQISNSLATQKAMALAAEIKYDRKTQTPYYDYTDPGSRRHRVYFEDARSIDAKLRLAEEYSLAGISLYSFESAMRSGCEIMQWLYNAEKLL